MDEFQSTRVNAVLATLRESATTVRSGLFTDCESRVVGEIKHGHVDDFNLWRHSVSLLFNEEERCICLALGAIWRAHIASDGQRGDECNYFLDFAEDTARQFVQSIPALNTGKRAERVAVARGAGLARGLRYTGPRNDLAVEILKRNLSAPEPVKFNSKSDVLKFLEDHFRSGGIPGDIVKPESVGRALTRSLKDSQQLRVAFTEYSGVKF